MIFNNWLGEPSQRREAVAQNVVVKFKYEKYKELILEASKEPQTQMLPKLLLRNSKSLYGIFVLERLKNGDVLSHASASAVSSSLGHFFKREKVARKLAREKNFLRCLSSFRFVNGAVPQNI